MLINKTFFLITSIIACLIVTSLSAAHNACYDPHTISKERYDRVCKWGIFNPPECRKKISKTNQTEVSQSDEVISNQKLNKTNNITVHSKKDPDCRYGIFNPPKCRKNYKGNKNKTISEYEIKTKQSALSKGNQNVSMYTGTFDIIDEEGDEKTNWVGIQHKNESLFRDTWFGRFSPTTGGFVTGKSSVYLYTGVEADYNLGLIKISPSFTPGYYHKGDGKDLGSALEFKSEIKFGFDLFENSNIGYSYSHISNNDWGSKNPGTDNQQITFSKNF